MSCFPFFIDIAGKHGLIVGGGRVALRKAEKLLDFGAHITVIAPEILPEFEREGVSLIRRSVQDGDITDDLCFVIAATGSMEVNHRCGELCRQKRILFNIASEAMDDMFVFPALYKQGPLTVGVTASGASPTAACWVRDRAAENVPENFGEILDQLSEMRATILSDETEPSRREKIFREMFFSAVAVGRPLTAEEIRRLL